MSEVGTSEPRSAGGEIGAERRDAALGRDGIAAVAVLLVAISGAGGWAPDSTLALSSLRALWVFFYLAALSRLVKQFGAQWATWTIRRLPELCILLALALASCCWSLAPLTTLRKAISLLGTTIVGISIGETLAPARFTSALLWTFTILIASSIAVALLVAAPVGEGVKSGWLGITAHPNSLGAAAVWATLCFLVLAVTRRVHPLHAAGLVAASVWALAQTRSRTSYATLGAGLLAFGYMTIARRRSQPIWPAWRRVALGLVTGLAVAPFLLAPLAPVLEDSDPLNGRMRLWDGALAILRERPLTGYGYAAVWGRAGATLLPHVAITAHRSASNAHNGIANVVSELGVPAAIVACICLFRALSDAARLFDRERSPFSFLALVLLIGFCVMNFGEAHLLQVHWFFWIAFVALTVGVKRALENPAARLATQR